MPKRSRPTLDDVLHHGRWVRDLMRPDGPFSDHFVKMAATELFTMARRYLEGQRMSADTMTGGVLIGAERHRELLIALVENTRLRKALTTIVETPQAVWMYYETDGDSGYYGIVLFTTKAAADRHHALQRDKAYGKVKEVEVKR